MRSTELHKGDDRHEVSSDEEVGLLDRNSHGFVTDRSRAFLAHTHTPCHRSTPLQPH